VQTRLVGKLLKRGPASTTQWTWTPRETTCR